MKVGDRVKLADPLLSTEYGVIIDKEYFGCKCKGNGRWLVDFNGEIKKIKIGDERLVLSEIKKHNL